MRHGQPFSPTCIPLSRRSLDVGDFLTRGPIKLGSLPEAFSPVVSAVVPYLATLRWAEHKRIATTVTGWNTNTEQTLDADRVPTDQVRFVIRADLNHNDTASNFVVWVCNLDTDQSFAGVALHTPVDVPAQRRVFLGPLVMGPNSALGMLTETAFANAARRVNFLQDVIDVPLGEWVAGPWGGL